MVPTIIAIIKTAFAPLPLPSTTMLLTNMDDVWLGRAADELDLEKFADMALNSLKDTLVQVLLAHLHPALLYIGDELHCCSRAYKLHCWGQSMLAGIQP